MISWFVALVASIAGFFSTDAWYAIIIGGSILFGITGNGWLTWVKFILALYAFWLFLSLIAWLLPLWLENLVVIAIALFFLWAYN